MNILQDEKGYIAQINVIKDFNNNIIIAGEDGLIKVNDKYLPKFIGIDGYLQNIEDIDIFTNGDIAVCATDGDVGIYKYIDRDNYQFILLDPHIYDDCLYNITIINEDDFIVRGERGIEYKYSRENK